MRRFARFAPFRPPFGPAQRGLNRLWGVSTYELDWTGRADAEAAAHTPPRAQVGYVGVLGDTSAEAAPTPAGTAASSGPTPTLPSTGSMVVEGDNLDALKHLRQTHKNRVSVVYIDPPYNTGNALPYRDTFGVAGHAGWMSMLLPRLIVARELMREDGVIFVSIDDREHAFLTLVGHQVFGEENFLGSFVHQRARGGGQARTWIRGHDYIAVWAKDASRVDGFWQEKRPPAKYETIDGQRYLVEDDVLRTTFGRYERGTERRLMYEDIEAVRGPAKKAQVDAWLAAGTHILRPWGDGKHAVVRITPAEQAASKMYSIVRALGHEGRNDLEALGLGGLFTYPKPVSLMRTLVRSRTFFDPEAVVLDFFAGSGTTAQAVMELNAEEGGRREFILAQKPEVLRPSAGELDSQATPGSITISELARRRVVAAAKAAGCDPTTITDVRLD